MALKKWIRAGISHSLCRQYFLLPMLVLVLAMGVSPSVSAMVQMQEGLRNDGSAFSGSYSSERTKAAFSERVTKGRVEEVRRLLPNEWGVPNPVGLSYSVERAQLALLASGGYMAIITPYEDQIGAVDVSFGAGADVSITYDDLNGYLLLLDIERSELGRLVVGADGIPDVNSLTRFELGHLDLERVGGIDVDEAESRLLVLDSGQLHITILELEPPFAQTETIDLAYLEDDSLSEIAVHSTNGHIFVLGTATDILYELSPQGTLLAIYETGSLALVAARGMDFGPSADLTDEPETAHLFLADSNWTGEGSSGSGTLTKDLFGSVLEVELIAEPPDHCEFNEH